MLWIVLVMAAVLAEAMWLAEPDVRRGDVRSIESHLVRELREAADERRLGTAALVLIRDGRIVAEHGFGTPVDPETTRFHVASVSKAVTAWGVMKLVQDGRVRLDEVRKLLSHTAGGSFAYSGEGYMALQRLIEQRTGRRFADYMRETVLQPLGMNHSGFECRVEDLAPNFDRNLNVVPYRPFTQLASAGLCASPRDLARFALAFVHDNPVLRRDTVRAMLTPQPGTGGSWGLGITLFAPDIAGHDGGTSPAWGAVVRVNPATANGMVIAASGARGAINQLSGDWTWWETGVMTFAARRQVAYDRARHALIAIVAGVVVIAGLRWRRVTACSR